MLVASVVARHRRDCVRRSRIHLAWINLGDAGAPLRRLRARRWRAFASRGFHWWHQAGPDLVACRGWPPGHRCRCCDISVARYNRDPASAVHRCLGIGTWHLRDYRRDPTAEGDRQRMDADHRRRAIGNFRRDYSHCPGRWVAWPGLGHRRLFNRFWYLVRCTRPAIAEAQPRYRISCGGVMTEVLVLHGTSA